MNTKMISPMVSIILCAFNGEKFLDFSIPSILAQTYPNWELLVVDDGSTDRTGKIVYEFQELDHRIRYIRLDRNYGLGTAMNTGLRNAKGDFIAFIEQDDAWLLKKIEYQINLFNKNDNLLFLSGPRWLFDYTHKRIFGIGPGNFSTYMFRNALFDLIGLFGEKKDLVGIEDGDLFARLHISIYSKKITADQVQSYPIPMVISCIHSSSLSSKRDPQSIEKRYKAVISIYKDSEGAKTIVNFWYSRLIPNLLLQGKKKEALILIENLQNSERHKVSDIMKPLAVCPAPLIKILRYIFHFLNYWRKYLMLKIVYSRRFRNEYIEAQYFLRKFKT